MPDLAAAGRADEPPRPRRARMARSVPAAMGRRLLVVSHDRYFLDQVTTGRSISLSADWRTIPRRYARYLDPARRADGAAGSKEYEEQQAFIARTEEFIRKYKAGQRSREARGRATRLDAAGAHRATAGAAELLELRSQSDLRSGRVSSHRRPLTIGYEHRQRRTLCSHAETCMIERGDRVGLVGPNGARQDDLLKTLIGEIPTLKGRFDFGTNVKPGYYAQAHEQLPARDRPLSDDPRRPADGRGVGAHLPRPLPLQRGRRLQAGRASSPAASGRGSRWPCCCCSGRTS